LHSRLPMRTSLVATSTSFSRNSTLRGGLRMARSPCRSSLERLRSPGFGHSRVR
jgi:hypothetical protein